MRNPGKVIVRCQAHITDFGGLFSAVSKPILRADTHFATFLEIYKTHALLHRSDFQNSTRLVDLFDEMLTKFCEIDCVFGFERYSGLFLSAATWSSVISSQIMGS